MQGWIGQALLAESAGYTDEAIDLFRHCTFLQNGLESAIGYAHWICLTLNEMAKNIQVRLFLIFVIFTKLFLIQVSKHNRYCVEQMFGVSVAIDALTHYVERVPDDACALNLLGNFHKPRGQYFNFIFCPFLAQFWSKISSIFVNFLYIFLYIFGFHVVYEKSPYLATLLERQNLLKSAKKFLTKALKLDMEPGLLDHVLHNLGRVLHKLKDFSAAVKCYGKMGHLDFYSQVGLALSLWSAEQIQEAYQAYGAALQLAQTSEQRSHVLAAMATIAYKFQVIFKDF